MEMLCVFWDIGVVNNAINRDLREKLFRELSWDLCYSDGIFV